MALQQAYAPHGPTARFDTLRKLDDKWARPSVIPSTDHVEHFSRLMARLNAIAEAEGLDKLPEWMQIAMLLRSINGVDDEVQRVVVDVLKDGDLRRKKFHHMVADLTGYGLNFKKMLEMSRTQWVDSKGSRRR